MDKNYKLTFSGKATKLLLSMIFFLTAATAQPFENVNKTLMFNGDTPSIGGYRTIKYTFTLHEPTALTFNSDVNVYISLPEYPNQNMKEISVLLEEGTYTLEIDDNGQTNDFEATLTITTFPKITLPFEKELSFISSGRLIYQFTLEYDAELIFESDGDEKICFDLYENRPPNFAGLLSPSSPFYNYSPILVEKSSDAYTCNDYSTDFEAGTYFVHMHNDQVDTTETKEFSANVKIINNSMPSSSSSAELSSSSDVEPSSSSNVESPIRITQLSAGNIHVYATSSAIVLENVPPGAKVEVYNLRGERRDVMHYVSTINGELKINVHAKGIYMVKINGKIFKMVKFL